MAMTFPNGDLTAVIGGDEGYDGHRAAALREPCEIRHKQKGQGRFSTGALTKNSRQAIRSFYLEVALNLKRQSAL